MDRTKTLLNELLQWCNDHGINVRMVSEKRLKDFGAMNDEAADKLGVPLKDKTIIISKERNGVPISVDLLLRNLYHEIFERKLMEDKDMTYWEAHLKALEAEKDVKKADVPHIAINESDYERGLRMRKGHTKTVTIDAKKFQDEYEKGGEKLAWNPTRAERLRDLPSFNAYPLVSSSESGRRSVGVTDGRHRIAEAARRGAHLDVAYNPSYPLPDSVIVKAVAVAEKPTGLPPGPPPRPDLEWKPETHRWVSDRRWDFENIRKLIIERSDGWKIPDGAVTGKGVAPASGSRDHLCYKNAIDHALKTGDRLVVGIAIDKGSIRNANKWWTLDISLHAWNLDKEGKVIDNIWGSSVAKDNIYYGVVVDPKKFDAHSLREYGQSICRVSDEEGRASIERYRKWHRQKESQLPVLEAIFKARGVPVQPGPPPGPPPRKGLKWNYDTHRWVSGITGEEVPEEFLTPYEPPSKEASVKIDKQVLEFANKYAYDTIEHVVAYDKNGDVVLEKSGNENQIAFIDSEKRKMVACANIVHNHPFGGGSFSAPDIMLGYILGVGRLTVVNDDQMFTLEGLNNVTEFDMATMEAHFQATYNVLRKKYTQRLLNSIVSEVSHFVSVNGRDAERDEIQSIRDQIIAKVWMDETDEIVKKIASDLGMMYKRQKIDVSTPKPQMRLHPSGSLEMKAESVGIDDTDNKPPAWYFELLNGYDPKKDTMRLFHATREVKDIVNEGIVPHEAGVRVKEGSKKVYTAVTFNEAIEAENYEDKLRDKAGKKVDERPLYVFEIEVPRKDVTFEENGDCTLDRKVEVSELRKLIRRNGKQISSFDPAIRNAEEESGSFSNTTEFEGKKYVNLGNTFMTDVDVPIGTVLDVNVQELTITQGKLTWAKPRVTGVAEGSKGPYSAATAISIAKKYEGVLQKAEKRTASQEDLQEFAEGGRDKFNVKQGDEGVLTVDEHITFLDEDAAKEFQGVKTYTGWNAAKQRLKPHQGSLHNDIRVNFSGTDFLQGMTVTVGKVQSRNKLIDNQEGDKLLIAGFKAATPRGKMKWQTDVGIREAWVFEPGEIGSPGKRWSAIFKVEKKATVKIGRVDDHFIEMKISGASHMLDGRWILMYAPIDPGNRVWILSRPKKQEFDDTSLNVVKKSTRDSLMKAVLENRG